MKIWKTLFLITFLLDSFNRCYAFESKVSQSVNEALEQDQRYDGELSDRLTALGSAAVPELCKHLETYAHPAEIIWVLAEFRDERSVPPLLGFLENRRDEWSSASPDGLCYYAVRALREISDPRAEDLLREIVSSESAHVSLKFNATAALARLGTSDIRKQAWEEISETYRTKTNVSQNSYPDSWVILEGDLYLAMCDVYTDEIDEALATFIRGGSAGYIKRPVFELLARRVESRNREKVIAALLEVAAHEYQKDALGDELLTQESAFNSLLRLEAFPPETLLRVAETWEIAIESVYGTFGDESFVAEYAERLRDLKEKLLTTYPQLKVQSQSGDSQVERILSLGEVRSEKPAESGTSSSIVDVPANSNLSPLEPDSDKDVGIRKMFITLPWLALFIIGALGIVIAALVAARRKTASK